MCEITSRILKGYVTKVFSDLIVKAVQFTTQNISLRKLINVTLIASFIFSITKKSNLALLVAQGKTTRMGWSVSFSHSVRKHVHCCSLVTLYFIIFLICPPAFSHQDCASGFLLSYLCQIPCSLFSACPHKHRHVVVCSKPSLVFKFQNERQDLSVTHFHANEHWPSHFWWRQSFLEFPHC